MKAVQAGSLLALAISGTIEQTFEEGAGIYNIDGDVYYGAISGSTRWRSSGIGADAELNLYLEIVATGTNIQSELFSNYKLQIVMSALDEDEEEANASDFFEIQAEQGSNGIIDTVTVGELYYPVDYVNYVAGEDWPELFEIDGDELIDFGATQRYRFSKDENAVRSNNASPDEQHWRIDQTRTRRDSEFKLLTLTLIRSKEYQGAANICAGCEVQAKIAFSPSGSDQLTWWNQYEIYWENEFSGDGFGSIKVSPAAKKKAKEIQSGLDDPSEESGSLALTYGSAILALGASTLIF